MLVVHTEAQRRHHPRFFIARGRVRPCPEVPERAERLLAAVRRAGHRVVAPEEYGPEPRATVHTARYLAFLEGAHRRWSELPDASPEIVPNVHPGPYMDAYPEGVVGQAGWHQADTACPIGAHTFEAACAAADAAVHAAELVLGGVAPFAYALCRPPGHHAYADRAGGFCFLNNSAIAAERLVRRTGGGRVAVLDVDVHHGNGTQGIFYDRGDVLTVSIHGDPGAFYPYFCGYAGERGAGAGEGANLNLPLPEGTGDAGYMVALDEALAAVRAFRPAALVVALGLDAFHGDPLAFLRVTTPGFGEMGRRIAALGLPTVVVQEGGYVCDALGDNLAGFLAGFEAGR